MLESQERYPLLPLTLSLGAFDESLSLVRNPTAYLLVSPDHLLNPMLVQVLVGSSSRINEETSGLRGGALVPLIA